ncbi:MAG TPA: M28 family peptidase [Chloroflexota bacterium]
MTRRRIPVLPAIALALALLTGAVATTLVFARETLCAELPCLAGLAPSSRDRSHRRFDADRAYRYLMDQVALGPRAPGTPGHAAGRAYLVEELERWADRVVVQEFTVHDGQRSYPMANIVGVLGPDRSPKVLLAAHWDTRPRAEHDPNPDRRGEPILGANDGASGVAVLLEVARVLHEAPPEVGVIIALFDGEDFGERTDAMFLGSRHWARQPVPERPAYGILLDMVGDADLEIPIERFSWERARPVVEKVWGAAERLGHRAFTRRIGGAVYDDHVPLLDVGIPMIDVIDFDYPYWHTTADTVDKTSPESLRVVGEVVLAVVYAERPEAP